MKKFYEQPKFLTINGFNVDVLNASEAWEDGFDFGLDDPYSL